MLGNEKNLRRTSCSFLFFSISMPQEKIINSCVLFFLLQVLFNFASFFIEKRRREEELHSLLARLSFCSQPCRQPRQNFCSTQTTLRYGGPFGRGRERESGTKKLMKLVNWLDLTSGLRPGKCSVQTRCMERTFQVADIAEKWIVELELTFVM